MAGRTAVLAIRVVADARGARRELDATGDSVQGVGKKAAKFAVPAAAVVGGLSLIAKSAIDSASVLQQSTGAVTSVFGKYAGSITKAAKGAATSVGLSMSSYQNLAVVLGSQLKNTGTPMDQVAGKTDKLIKKGADLAAMFGGTTADAVSAISSLMRGERDPIERYGVSISQAAIDAYNASKGLTKLTGAAKKTADTQATLALLTKQTAAAQGQFSRETSTAAGATEISNAKFENTKALLGTKLLPVVARVKGMMGSLFGLLAHHVGTVQILAGVLGGLAVVILLAAAYTKAAALVQGIYAVVTGEAAAATGLQTVALGVQKGAMIAGAIASKVFAAGQWLVNAALSANPIGLVVIAIAALIAGFILAYKHSQTFRNIVAGVFAVLKVVVGGALAYIRFQINLAITVIKAIGNAFQTAYTTAARWIGNIVSGVAAIPGKIAGFATHMVSAGAGLIGSLFSGIVNGIRHAGGAVADVVGRFVNGIASAINNLLNLPWVIKLHINGPGPLPDLNFGPFTLLPRIPVSASAMLPDVPDLDTLRPGWTLLASALNPFAWTAGIAPTAGSAMASSTTIVNVTFSGLVADPDGTARAIEDLLAGRRVRLGNGRR